MASTLSRANNLPPQIGLEPQLYITLFQDNIDHDHSPPHQEREGFSRIDSTQYCNSRKPQDRKETQLQEPPPMHKIQWKINLLRTT